MCICCGIYQSPLGEILLVGNRNKLTNLYFSGSVGYQYCLEHFFNNTLKNREMMQVFDIAKHWLDSYFSGHCSKKVPINLSGSYFCRLVWRLVSNIPYGFIVSYGCLASHVADIMQYPKMSAQAVGHALGKNPLPIFVPCHRVIGADGSLKGYVGGVSIKRKLLALEDIYCKGLSGDFSDFAMQRLISEFLSHENL